MKMELRDILYELQKRQFDMISHHDGMICPRCGYPSTQFDFSMKSRVFLCPRCRRDELSFADEYFDNWSFFGLLRCISGDNKFTVRSVGK